MDTSIIAKGVQDNSLYGDAMIDLLVPHYAIRQKPGMRRKSYSQWHFQNPDKMNKTVCGIIIADGRGWKRRLSPSKLSYAYRQRWEKRDVSDIRGKKSFCKVCLGAMVVE
jgi:hypothetical protein